MIIDKYRCDGRSGAHDCAHLPQPNYPTLCRKINHVGIYDGAAGAHMSGLWQTDQAVTRSQMMQV